MRITIAEMEGVWIIADTGMAYPTPAAALKAATRKATAQAKRGKTTVTTITWRTETAEGKSAVNALQP